MAPKPLLVTNTLYCLSHCLDIDVNDLGNKLLFSRHIPKSIPKGEEGWGVSLELEHSLARTGGWIANERRQAVGHNQKKRGAHTLVYVPYVAEYPHVKRA